MLKKGHSVKVSAFVPSGTIIERKVDTDTDEILCLVQYSATDTVAVPKLGPDDKPELHPATPEQEAAHKAAHARHVAAPPDTGAIAARIAEHASKGIKLTEAEIKQQHADQTPHIDHFRHPVIAGREVQSMTHQRWFRESELVAVQK